MTPTRYLRFARIEPALGRAAQTVAEDSTQIRRLPPGALFEDCNGQQFAKLGVIVNRLGVRKQLVQCLWSPMGRKVPGEISGAFFTHIGALLYLGGNRRVHRAEPVPALPWRAAA